MIFAAAMLTCFAFTTASVPAVAQAAVQAVMQASADELESDQVAIEGFTIAELSILGAPNEDLTFLRKQLDLETGYLFSRNDVANAIERLYSIGRFRDVRVHARVLGPRTIALTFVLEYPFLIDKVETFGSPEDELATELRPLLQEGTRVDEVLTGEVQRRCRRFYLAEGFPSGTCDLELLEDQAKGVTRFGRPVPVNLRVVRGAPLIVREVRILGKHRAPTDMLMPLLTVRVGERLKTQALREDERTLKLQFFERGFLQANIKAEVTFRDGDETKPIVTYDIEATERVVVQVKGNTLFRDGELLGELKRAPDERLFPATLEEWRRRVLERYRQAGWLEVNAVLTQRIESKRAVLHHVLEIDERFRVNVDQIDITGASFYSADRLRDELLAVIDERLDVPLITPKVEHDATATWLDADEKEGSVRRPGLPTTHSALRTDTSAVFEPDIYQAGLDAIRNLYIEQGFTEVAVGPIELEKIEDGRSLIVKVPVREGPRTLIADVTLSGMATLSESTLREAARLQAQQPLTDLALEEAKLAMLRAYNRAGHLYATIEETTRLSADKTLAFVNFDIREGEQVRVSRVLVQGNKLTHDSVIRDRLAVAPDEVYSEERAQQTKENLFSATSLGGAPAQIEAFESAQVSLIDPEVPTERKDVIVKVVERKPQSLDFGLGVSTGQGIRGFLEYTHRNLFGRAVVLGLRLSANRQLFFDPAFYGPFASTMAERYASFNTVVDQIAFAIERQFRASLRTPRNIQWPLQPLFYTELSNERRNATAFSLDAFAFLAGVDFLLNSRLSLALENGVNVNRLTCANPDRSGCQIRNSSGGVVAIPEGFFLSYRAGPKLVLDLRPREERANARRGLLANVRADFITGRQLNTGRPYTFIRAEAQVRGYIPIGKRQSIALVLSGGNIFTLDGERQVRIVANERFFLGGPTTLRGMVDQSLIPSDACLYDPVTDANQPRNVCSTSLNGVQRNPDGAPIPPGGKFYVLAKAEYRFPLVGDLFASGFVDVGNLYFDVANFNPADLRFNVGAGLRYAFGSTGSIVLDFGFNVSPRRALGETPFTFPYFYFGVF